MRDSRSPTPKPDRDDAPTYAIGELADAAGVSRRTVRFYVQKGLIDPPLGRGRGSAYTGRHLEQIRRVRELQRGGLELDSIRDLPAGVDLPRSPAPGRPRGSSLVIRVPIGPGLRLEIDASLRIPGDNQLAEIAAACARILDDRSDKDAGKDGVGSDDAGDDDTPHPDPFPDGGHDR